MQKISFEDTTVVKSPYVIIDGVEHEVYNGTYQGGTDLNAQTFNQMQDNIESAIEDVEDAIPTIENSLDSDSITDAPSVHAVKQLNTYSEDETIVGIFNGKPLYRKILWVTPTAQYDTYNHNISNLETLLPVKGMYQRDVSGYLNNIPSTYTGWEVFVYDFTLSSFVLRFSNNVWSAGIYSMYLIFEYTKTTD